MLAARFPRKGPENCLPPTLAPRVGTGWKAGLFLKHRVAAVVPSGVMSRAGAGLGAAVRQHTGSAGICPKAQLPVGLSWGTCRFTARRLGVSFLTPLCRWAVSAQGRAQKGP